MSHPRVTGASRTTRAIRLPEPPEVVAQRKAEEKRRCRAVRIWTTGGHVFDGRVDEKDVERHLRDGLRAAPDPGATIDLHDGDTVVAVVAAHVTAIQFVRPHD